MRQIRKYFLSAALSYAPTTLSSSVSSTRPYKIKNPITAVNPNSIYIISLQARVGADRDVHTCKNQHSYKRGRAHIIITWDSIWSSNSYLCTQIHLLDSNFGSFSPSTDHIFWVLLGIRHVFVDCSLFIRVELLINLWSCYYH